MDLNAKLVVALTVLMAGCSSVPKSAGPKQASSLELELHPSAAFGPDGTVQGPPTQRFGDELEVWYADLGSDIALVLRSRHQAFVQFDINQNGVVDSSVDRSYGSCVQMMSDSPDCTETAARSSTRRIGVDGEVSWRIPKAEIASGFKEARAVFGTFRVADRETKAYPAPAFRAAYRLQFGAPRGVALPGPDWPGSSGAAGTRLAGSAAPPVPEAGGSASRGSSLSHPVVSLSAEPGSIETGAAATIRWNATGADRVRIEPDIGIVPPNGTREVHPTRTTRYTLSAEGRGGVSTSEATVNVSMVPPPSIVSFRGDPATITANGSALLRWQTTGRTARVRIEPGFDSLPRQGEREVHPRATTVYRVVAEGPGGTDSAELTLRVSSPAAPSITLSAEPRSISAGSSSRLRWSVTGASRVSIQPDVGSVNPADSLVIRPLSTTSYTLTAEGPGGVVTRTVYIEVLKPTRSSGELVWTGTVNGEQMVTIERDRANTGSLSGSLPGLPCLVLPTDEKKVAIASSPGPRNDYERLVFRVSGRGPVRVVIKWSLQ